MIATATATTIVIIALVVLVAGATNGLAGFGFAVVGTMALATVIDPAAAVVFMIIPILAVNASLVRELSNRELRRCSRRFWPLIGAALFGTAVGMALLDRLPETPLRVGLGVVTLGFVLAAQRRIPLPRGFMPGGSERFKTKPGMVAVGGISGALFGGTNVGVAIGTGTDIAIQSSDLSLVRGSLDALVDALTLSEKIFSKIKQNLFWAFIYNTVAIPIAFFGLLHPVIAVAAMITSSISVITNSTRLGNIEL